MSYPKLEEDEGTVADFVTMNDGVSNETPLGKYADWIPQCIRSGGKSTRTDRGYLTSDEDWSDYALYEDIDDPFEE